MTQKVKQLKAAGNGSHFPPEAYEYNDDVSTETVKTIREEHGLDVREPRWKTIDAFGQIVTA